MKQQILNLKKKILLVELPEGIVAPEKSDNICIIQDIICFRTSNMKPTLRSFGKLTDITESLCAEWVFKSRIGTYKDYTCAPKSYDKIGLIDALLEMKFKTAKESFFSKLEAAGICFQSKNNLDKPDRNEYNFSYGHNESDLYNKHIKNWQEAESKLWKKDRCCLFEILN